MKKIKVTRGGCGINYTDANGNTRHALKTAESGPFECDDAQADRLVRLGVAAYVGEAKIPAPSMKDYAKTQQEGQDKDLEQSEEKDEIFQEPEKATGHLDAADLETWDYKDLKKLAADMGVKPNGQKKADYIEAIVAAEVEYDVEDDGDELPELGAADPE